MPRPRPVPRRDDLPSTLARSPLEAQWLWKASHDAAVQQYGEGERAHRTAFAALKRSFEKIGDHWEAKTEHGPSEEPGDAPRGGVDATARRAHLLELAGRLGVRGRHRMTRPELVHALELANERATRRAREDGDSG